MKDWLFLIYFVVNALFFMLDEQLKVESLPFVSPFTSVYS